MAKKHDNQFTTRPLTENELVQRFKALLPHSAPNGHEHDWVSLFVSFIRSTKAEFKNVAAFCGAKGISTATLQQRGGRAFWNQARQVVHVKALATVVDRSPEVVAKKYEKDLRIVSKLQDAMEHAIDRMRRLQQAELIDPSLPVNPYESMAMKALIEGIHKLVETNVLLTNEGVHKFESKNLNLHANLVKAIKERDQQFDVPE